MHEVNEETKLIFLYPFVHELNEVNPNLPGQFVRFLRSSDRFQYDPWSALAIVANFFFTNKPRLD